MQQGLRIQSVQAAVERFPMGEQYHGYAESIVAPRNSWQDDPVKRWNRILQRMTPGQVEIVEGIAVYRNVVDQLWWDVEGEKLKLDKALSKMKWVKDQMPDRQPLPWFSVTEPQQKIIHFWRKYQHENNDVPTTREAKDELRVCSQRINMLLKQLVGLGLMTQEDISNPRMSKWYVDEEAIERMGLKI